MTTETLDTTTNFLKHCYVSKEEKEWNRITHPEFMYFISDGEFVKIGRSKNIQQRLHGLQSSNPRNLELIGCHYPEDSMSSKKHEKYWHETFAPYKVRGEWFNLPEEAVEYIQESLCPTKTIVACVAQYFCLHYTDEKHPNGCDTETCLKMGHAMLPFLMCCMGQGYDLTPYITVNKNKLKELFSLGYKCYEQYKLAPPVDIS